MQEKDQVPKKRKLNTETKAKQEASEEQHELDEEDLETNAANVELECFLKNYATSTCLDSAKETQYVGKEGARRLLRGQ